ncbi:MAG: hypothetical protein ABIH25_04325 [Candidatus Woesearchaeota archaeon]
MGSIKSTVGLYIAIFGLTALVARGCNMAWNNKNVEELGRHTVSNATKISGHEEFTLYPDGSSDLKIYPGIMGHRYMSSKLYQDIDGDQLVDRIRINGPEWQFNRLKDVLVRSTDYSDYKDEFDKADRKIRKKATSLK